MTKSKYLFGLGGITAQKEKKVPINIVHCFYRWYLFGYWYTAGVVGCL